MTDSNEQHNPPGPDKPPAPAPLPRETDLARWIAEGWRLIRDDLIGYVIATFLLLVIGILALRIHAVVSFLLVAPLQAGIFLMTTNHLRGRGPVVGDMFQAFSMYVPVILGGFLMYAFTAIGMIACLIPALFVMGIYQFSYLFMVDRGMDFWEAMEASRMLAKKDYLEFSLFALVLLVLNLAGLLALGIGIFVTVPLTFASITCAYRDLAGLAVEPAIKTARTPEEYSAGDSDHTAG